MKMLNHDDFEEIRGWMHRNARPVELSMWNYLYEKGTGEEVIRALGYYQNEDGGFGRGIELDCWNTESSPYATLKAVKILKNLHLLEEMGAGHPMIKKIFRYLDSGVHCGGNGWLFCISSNDRFPRAPWWTYSEDTNKVQSLGVTAPLCGFILRYGADSGELYKKAVEFAGNIINSLTGIEDFGDMGLEGVAELLQDVEQSGMAGALHCGGLIERLKKAADCAIERNPDNWQFYTPRPSGFISSPESLFYPGNEEITDIQLDYLIETRKPGGVWDITWSWFDMGEVYPKEFAVSENWWMATVAIDNLEFLRNFGRIE